MKRPGRKGSESSADRVRVRAASILATWSRGRRHVEDLVEDFHREAADARSNWTHVERRRVSELVYGAVRLRARYDFLVARHARRTVDPLAAATLWIALHELIELGEKSHAVVDQANRVVAALGRPQARGFVNAVLRAVLREGAEAAFPSADDDPLAHATTWLSMPEWIAERWRRRLGDADMLALCRAQNRRPATHLRAVPGGRDALAEALAAFEWQARPVDLAPDALELVTRIPVAVLVDQIEAPFAIQDAAAQLVAPIVALDAPREILDLCAAPGGKTLHLAQLLPASRITAVDLGAERLERVRQNAERLGVADRVELVTADARAFDPGERRFDAVLVDAPCTGTGVLARRQDARWNRRPSDLEELPPLQSSLLERAVDLVRPGGTVVYATCSLEEEENDRVVDSLLAKRQDVEELGVDEAVPAAVQERGRLQTWPHRDGIDGAFAARLRRLESSR